MRLLIIIVGWLFWVNGAYGQSLPQRVRVRVDMAVRQAGLVVPVTGGVPLPKGALKEAANARVLSSRGEELPAQFRVLMRWPDGSVKWLLCDFQADASPEAKTDYTLVLNSRAPSRIRRYLSPLRVKDTGDEIGVDTGVVRFAVPKKGGWLLKGLCRGASELVAEAVGEVSLEPQGDAGKGRAGDYLTVGDSGFWAEVTESGPMRLCITMRGWHRTADGRQTQPYTLWLHAYRNCGVLRLVHTGVISENGMEVLYRCLGLRLRTAFKVDDVGFGEGRNQVCWIRRGRMVSGQTLRLLQDSAKYLAYPEFNQFEPFFRLTAKTQELARGEKASGWIGLSGQSGSVFVALKDFWRLYPKALSAGEDGLGVEFWPREGVPPMDLRPLDVRMPEDYRRFVESEPDGKYWYDYALNVYQKRKPAIQRSGLGTARTHEVLLGAGAGALKPEEAEFWTAWLNDPPLLFVSGEWNRDTGVLGRFHPEDRRNYPLIEATWEAMWDTIIKHQHEWSHWFGFWNYGDIQTFYDPLKKAWGNYKTRFSWRGGEVEIPHSAFLQYLRTGQRKYFRLAEGLARHLMDVGSFDPVCISDGRLMPPDALIASGVRHDMSHWGCGKGQPPGQSASCDHMFAHGFLDYYALTGDSRAREMLLKYGDAALKTKIISIGHDYHDHTRNEDQAMRVLANAWEVSGDEKFWKGLEFYIKHETEGLNFYEDAQGIIRLRCNNAEPQALFLEGYKQQAIGYVLYLTGDEALAEAWRKAMRLYVGEGRCLAGMATLFQTTGNLGYARAAGRFLRAYVFHGQRAPTALKADPALVPNTVVMGALWAQAPYALAAVHDAKLENPEKLVGRHYDTYPLAEPPQPLAQEMQGYTFQPLDISAVANGDGINFPFGRLGGEKREGKVTFPVLQPGDIGFDFEPTSGLAPGYLPVTAAHEYPATALQPDSNTSLSGLPFGATFTVSGIPFSLGNSGTPNCIVLTPGKSVRIPVGFAAHALYVLGQVCGERVVEEQEGARYVVRYQDGTADTFPLVSMRHYQYWRSQLWYADEVHFAGKYRWFNLGLMRLPCKGKEVVALEFADVAGHRPCLLAVTAERKGNPERWDGEIVLPSERVQFSHADAAQKSHGCTLVRNVAVGTVAVPPSDYLVEVELAVTTPGCPLDIAANGRLVLNHVMPLEKTAYSFPVKVSTGSLQLAIRPKNIRHKTLSAQGEVQLYAVRWRASKGAGVKPAATPVVAAPFMSAPRGVGMKPLLTEQVRSDVTYGWLTAEGMMLQDVINRTSGAVVKRETEEVNLITEDGVRTDKSADMHFRADVPNGRYRVSLYLRGVSSETRVDVMVGDKHIPSVNLLPLARDYVLLTRIPPVETDVEVKGGKLDILVRKSADSASWGAEWQMCGLVLRGVQEGSR